MFYFLLPLSLLRVFHDLLTTAIANHHQVTFTTADAFLILPAWDAGKQASLSFKLRTNEPSGVVVYSTGASNGPDQTADFFAFEMLEGHLYMLINLGSGTVKVKVRVRESLKHTHTNFTFLLQLERTKT